jgi:hypothetical protein
VLVLTVFGVAYTTFSRQPIKGYWEVLVPFIVLVCIGAGWQNASDSAGRWCLVVTQALHWLAFVVVINMMLLPTVQRNFSANATGLAIFTLLSLGTFTAGVHLLSWQVCLLGLIMAFGIPVLAWVLGAVFAADRGSRYRIRSRGLVALARAACGSRPRFS